MGFFKKVFKTAKKIGGLAAPFAAKIGPWAPYVAGAYLAYQGISGYYKGKKQRKYAKREGERAIQEAAEYAEYIRQQGDAAAHAWRGCPKAAIERRSGGSACGSGFRPARGA